ncbi:MAG: hypothetical protein QOI33_2985 [Mycobacterium sp.]|nr:hypothetical protein [Mycobacterium sp.]
MSKVRAISGAADQVFSSLSNGLIIYAVAVITPPEKFGQIVLLLTLLVAAVGLLRGALGTPLLLMAGLGKSDIRREGAFAVASALLVSPIVGGLIWAVAGSGIRLPAIMIMMVTPIVLVEDVLRYVAIAQGRPHVAALWDGVWFAGSAALLVATWVHLPGITTAYLIGGWAALAFLALVGLLVGVRVGPRLRQYQAWISDGWRHRARYGIESGLEQTLMFAVLLFAAVVLSPEVSAALRGASALLAPVSIAAAAIPLVVIPESRRRDMPPSQVWRSLTRVALVYSSAALVAGVALFFMPLTVGELALGSTFQAAQAIVPIVAFEYAIGAWVFAVVYFLRTFNRSADVLKLKVSWLLVTLVPVFGGAMIFRTAAGIAAGIATATTFVAVVMLLRFKPWATPTSPSSPERLHPVAPDSSRAGRTGRDARWEATGPLAAHDLLNAGMPRPMPPATRLRAHETAQVNEALITVWIFVTLAVITPAVIVSFTGIAANWYWLWSLPVTAICAARFAWLIGNGERRLFEMIFWGYSYGFLGLAPLTQLREGLWPDTVPHIDNAYIAAGALIAIVGCGAFLVGAGVDNATSLGRSWQAVKRTQNNLNQAFSINYRRTVLLCGFAILVNIYYLSHVGWLQFLLSREEASIAATEAWPSAIHLDVLVGACSAMALLVAFIALMRFRNEAKRARMCGENASATVMRSSMALTIIIGMLLANTMNPLSNARQFAGATILAAATAFGLFTTRHRFRAAGCGFLAGMFVIFPLADAFRFSGKAELKATNPIQALLSNDFDSFAQIMNGYLVGAREGIVPGRQLFGVLFFWVPRTMWRHKPVDTAQYIADGRGYGFTNLSSPLWIEFYLNGGWVLLAVGMFALGFGLHRWDTRLDTQFDVYRMPGLLGCILPFFLMIVLRGPLLQAATYLGFIVVFATFVQRRKSKARPRLLTGAPEPGAGLPVPHHGTNHVYA